VRQPWAWAIIHGGKDVENRVRNLAGDYRGPIAIHAGLAPYEKGTMAGARRSELFGGEDATTLVFGAIIGVVDLVDVHEGPDRTGCWCRPGSALSCSPWAEGDAVHLVLANPRPLATPIPYKGGLGLRRFNETVDTEVLRQLAEVA
jgi:hypothetical protein